MTDNSILYTVIKTSVSILSIAIAYLFFLNENKKNHIMNLNSLFIKKAHSLIDFVNREISIAYEGTPFLRMDYSAPEEIIENISQYYEARKCETPIVGYSDTKKLIVLLSIYEGELKDLKKINKNVNTLSRKPLMEIKSFIIFLFFFVFELFIGMLSLYMIYIDYIHKELFVHLTIIIALISIIPIMYLIYELQFKHHLS